MFSLENEDHLSKRTVKLAIIGHQLILQTDKPGYFEYILIDDETDKYVKLISERESNITPNRAILKGLIHALSRLKYPCHVKVFSKVSIGFKKMINEGNSPNIDLLQQLKEVILTQEHVIEKVTNIEQVDLIFEKYV